MAHYLSHPCPPSNGYLGVVLRAANPAMCTDPLRDEPDIESSARGRERLDLRLAHFLDDVLKRFEFRQLLKSEPLKISR